MLHTAFSLVFSALLEKTVQHFSKYPALTNILKLLPLGCMNKIVFKRGKHFKTMNDLQLLMRRNSIRYVVKDDDAYFDVICLYLSPNGTVIKKERFSGVSIY